ncbi:hypothetical protein BWX42_03940 [Dolosigranulum pigrum]|uniref:Uncharacterized protein n=1 Tax=Dolosigranulum pigrum TaxID=29394 RepID=A0A1S8KNF0_9LACT|nr:hypothetical protein BWX42_03940 [Dolosigranulum pigrum]
MVKMVTPLRLLELSKMGQAIPSFTSQMGKVQPLPKETKVIKVPMVTHQQLVRMATGSSMA